MVAADGVAVAAWDLGGDGPSLLLAHATGFHGQVFAPIAAHLAARFHCWSFDHRGHGDTAAPPGWDFRWDGFAADVLAVVDGLRLDRPAAVGHSAGGAALLLAEQARPGTFRALYLFEPVVFPPDWPRRPDAGSPLSAGARRRREVFPTREDAYATYAAKPPLGALAPEALRAYVDHGFADLGDGSVRLKCRGADEARVYEMATVHDLHAGLARVRCPVTVACGERTDAFGPALLAPLLGGLPAGRLEVLPALGHFGPLEDPAAVAASVGRALSPS